MKTTAYFDAIRQRLDRKVIKDEWIERVIDILLPDGETVHNAFFDRRFLS